MTNYGKPLHHDNDSDGMRHAIERIKEEGFMLHRPSPYHLKVGTANFYPTTGKITIDPTVVHPARGVGAYLKLLRKLYGDPNKQHREIALNDAD